MVRNYIEGIKSFFRNLGGIITPKAGRHMGVVTGSRVYFDAEQALANDYLSSPGAGQIEVVNAALRRILFSATGIVFSVVAIPVTDNNIDIGATATRWEAGYFGTQVGIHSGAAWTTSLQSGAITIASLPAITHFGPEQMLLGDGGAPYIPTVPSLATEANITTPVNGMIYYNQTLNKFRGREAGAWVDLV